MSYRGRVRNGAVVVDAPAQLPEGAIVEVVVVSEPTTGREACIPTLAERYAAVVGIVEGLPPDLGTLHDHAVTPAGRQSGHE